MTEMSLRVLVWNLENLFLLSDQELNSKSLEMSEKDWQGLSTALFPNKPLHKLYDMQKLIKSQNPDILLLCEVGGGEESLNNFNRLFLNDTYRSFLIEGNSDRHIHIGCLVRRSLPYLVDYQSNRRRPLDFKSLAEPQKSFYFSRDVGELSLYSKEKPDQAAALFLLVHLKSRLDPSGFDPGGLERRSSELRGLLEIYNLHAAKNIPIFLAGDFNGHAALENPAPEFKPLQNTNLKELMSISGFQDSQDLATFFQVHKHKTEALRLDYVFMNPLATPLLIPGSAKTLPFSLPGGTPRPPPRSMMEKDLWPSDHLPLVFDLSL